MVFLTLHSHRNARPARQTLAAIRVNFLECMKTPAICNADVLTGHISTNATTLSWLNPQATQNPDGSFSTTGQRLPNGVWFGKSGPRNGCVSTVLIASKLDVYRTGPATPVLARHSHQGSRKLIWSHACGG